MNILEKIKHFILKRKSTAILKKRREKTFVNFDEATQILVLFDSDYNQKNLYIREVINILREEGKEVYALGYIANNKSTEAIQRDFSLFDAKQCHWYGQPKQEITQRIINRAFDLIINLSLTDQIPLLYLTLSTKAKCKTGKFCEILPLYDFTILPPETPIREIKILHDLSKNDKEEGENSAENSVSQEYLYNQIVFYLKNIRTER